MRCMLRSSLGNMIMQTSVGPFLCGPVSFSCSQTVSHSVFMFVNEISFGAVYYVDIESKSEMNLKFEIGIFIFLCEFVSVKAQKFSLIVKIQL